MTTSLKHWQGALSPQAQHFSPAMSGRFCHLQPLDCQRDAHALYKALSQNHEHSWAWLPYGPFDSFDAFDDWLQKFSADPDLFLLTVSRVNAKGESKVSGLLALMNIRPEQGVMEVGHVHFGAEMQQTPAATECQFLLMQYAFEVLGMRRYEWKCNNNNQASKTAALRLGFQYEGLFRQAAVVKGESRDTAWFSVIDGEWPVLKREFQRWLAAENFDQAGQQLSSLTQTN